MCVCVHSVLCILSRFLYVSICFCDLCQHLLFPNALRVEGYQLDLLLNPGRSQKHGGSRYRPEQVVPNYYFRIPFSGRAALFVVIYSMRGSSRLHALYKHAISSYYLPADGGLVYLSSSLPFRPGSILSAKTQYFLNVFF